MDVLIIDAQGGGIGKQLIAGLKKKNPDINIVAVGSNSVATQAMKKAGADDAATGENSVVVCSKKVKVIAGPIGIVMADSMLGEITSVMAEAVGKSEAERVLIPMNRCETYVAGIKEGGVSALIQDAVDKICEIVEGQK